MTQLAVPAQTATITGAGKSTMAIRVSRRASTGTHTITVTGTSGGTSHSTTISLDVTTAANR